MFSFIGETTSQRQGRIIQQIPQQRSHGTLSEEYRDSLMIQQISPLLTTCSLLISCTTQTITRAKNSSSLRALLIKKKFLFPMVSCILVMERILHLQERNSSGYQTQLLELLTTTVFRKLSISLKTASRSPIAQCPCLTWTT